MERLPNRPPIELENIVVSAVPIAVEIAPLTTKSSRKVGTEVRTGRKRRRKNICNLLIWNGGAEGSRTPDLLIANETLYQLSYDPNQFNLKRLQRKSLGVDFRLLYYMVLGMSKTHARAGKFRKVGENLYRYSSNGVYYAVFRDKGKLKWKSLKTPDKDLAKRRLRDEIELARRIDPNASRMSLAGLLDLYKENLKTLDTRTIATRRSILNRFKDTWPLGLEVQVKWWSSGVLLERAPLKRLFSWVSTSTSSAGA